MPLKRTPLFPIHQKYGGKLIDFVGWELPVEYKGIIEEHMMVRTKAGMFDVSHMGEIEVKGANSTAFINKLLTNNFAEMEVGQVRYALMCNENGGVVDDVLVYKISSDCYLIVVNAANSAKDFDWLKNHVSSDKASVTDVSSSLAQIAIQGPLAQEILQPLCKADLKTIKYYHFFPDLEVSGIKCIVSRTGYTGEDGFEIYVAPEDACLIWESILEKGGEDITPCGLGARDTLRLEAKLPLYGHEIDEDITPLEAGLDRFVKFEKDFFIGKESLENQKKNGLERKLMELEMVERGLPRHGYEIQKNNKKIGYVTSGGYLPFLDKNLGLGLIQSEFAEIGSEVEVIIRKRAVKARLGKDLFYSRNNKN